MTMYISNLITSYYITMYICAYVRIVYDVYTLGINQSISLFPPSLLLNSLI